MSTKLSMWIWKSGGATVGCLAVAAVLACGTVGQDGDQRREKEADVPVFTNGVDERGEVGGRPEVQQEAPTGFELPNSSEVHPVSTSAPCSDEEAADLAAYASPDDFLHVVFASARNAAREDPGSHIYLYRPPLRFRLTPDGQVLVQESEQDVVVYLEGAVDSRTHERILTCLAHRLGRPLNSAQLQPLQFRSISLTGTESISGWRSSIPVNEGAIPLAAQRWHRFAFRKPRTEMGSREFVDRLRRADANAGFRVMLSYGGGEIITSSVEIVTSDLLDTNFLRDLTGDGRAELVTRSQLDEAGVQAFQQIRRTSYRERNLEPPPFDWLEGIWRTQMISWDDFLNRRLQDLSRYGFNEDDLSPDKFNSFLDHVNEQLEDKDKDTITIDTRFKAEADFLEIGGGAEGQLSFSKEEFRSRLESSEHQIEWTGERFVPRDVEVYVINEDALARDQLIYDRAVRIDSGDAFFEYVMGVQPAENLGSGELVEHLAALERRLSTLEGVGDYSIRLFNVDDIMAVSVNGRQAVECRFRQDRGCYLLSDDIARFLDEGRTNVVVITVENTGGPYAFGYEVWRNGVLLHADSCGNTNVSEAPRCGRYPGIQSAGTTEVLRFIIDRR